MSDAAASDEQGGRAAEPGRGMAVAYAFLNRRERTVAEVRARLERAEVDAGEADAVVAELIELGHLDDARYARVFTEDRRTLDSWGNERIARTLRERGVARELADAALQADPAEGELARAVALLETRFREGPGDLRDRERAFGVLARRGYGSETAAGAVREWVRRTAE